MNKKFVRIDYTIREDVDLDAYLAKVSAFVAAMGARNPDHRYSVFQDSKNARRFTHVGEFVADDVPQLTAQPFFGEFTSTQRPLCVTPPEVTSLIRAACAHD